MAKARRHGPDLPPTIFAIDRMSTAVAPLSPRGRPGAPVSFPLNWGQVKRGLDPLSASACAPHPSCCRKPTPGRSYCDSERPLAPAIKKLGGRTAA
ncbi:MAG: hypothetical protein QM757_46205 [Paludibaculum sp.]